MDEEKKFQVLNSSTQPRAPLPPRGTGAGATAGTSGIANPPRRKPTGLEGARGQNDTPDTTRAMGGSDRLLRSQSKTQTGGGGGGGVVVSGGVGGTSGGPHQPPARSSSNQQNWY